MIRLSIIIPVYNVEPYVERCIRSIENQNIDRNEYEIICINDGSPDRSRFIIMKLQKEFDNIILIEQENQGVSRARNKGIKKAKGDFILFVDPDDYIKERVFHEIFDKISKKNLEVIFLGFTIINSSGSVNKNFLYKRNLNKIYNGIEAYHLARGDGRTDPDRIWGILFKRTFILKYNLKYLPDVPFLEDGELIARILCLAKKCTFVSYSFYIRTWREGSATKSNLYKSDKAVRGFIKIAINLRNFRNSKATRLYQKEFLNQPIVKFVILSISSTVKFSSINRFIKVRRTLYENNFDTLELQGCNALYKRLGLIYNKSVYLLYIYLVFYSLARNIKYRMINLFK